MIRTHLFIPEEASGRLKLLGEKTGLPVSEHIRRAIDEYLERRGVRRVKIDVGTYELLTARSKK
jgi:predicted transcriptional regulator